MASRGRSDSHKCRLFIVDLVARGANYLQKLIGANQGFKIICSLQLEAVGTAARFVPTE
jgi:hypothetical protein